MARAKENTEAEAPIEAIAGTAASTDKADAARDGEIAKADAAGKLEPVSDPGAPGAGGPDEVERRHTTLTGTVSHDGLEYAAGARIPLTEDQFDSLRKAGLTEEAFWEDCS